MDGGGMIGWYLSDIWYLENVLFYFVNIDDHLFFFIKEEGLMAYSSCSMNQIENEAVVAQVLYFITLIYNWFQYSNWL